MAQQLKTDWMLLLTIVLMACLGMVMIYSASSVMAEVRFGDSNRFALRQISWMALGFVALMYFKRKDYRSLEHPAWAFASLGTVMILLAAAYLADRSAHRWLRVGSFGMQPSEFAKPALAIFLAWFISRRAHAINTRHTWGPAALALGLPAAVVLAADMGTAAVMVATAAVVFFVAGLDSRIFLKAAVLALLALALGVFMAPERRIPRLVSFFKPLLVSLDPQLRLASAVDPSQNLKKWLERPDTDYHARQSKLAVASGGVLGLGLMQGKQKLLYLPEAHNDFIYAVVCEELGLWGALAVLLGFLIILWRGVQLYWTVPDDFGRYLALGISTGIVVQALLNISVVLDLAPTKGFPLPLISYGGSSLVSSLASLGILLSVSEHAG